MQCAEPAAAAKGPEGEGKAEPAAKSGGRGAKGWQYSDHMENICGYLMKYTNLVTGWQYRFFVLNNDAGLLEYFVNEQSRHLKPRGTLQLAGAVISPSDEDSHTFTVNAASGEQYKLRATDAKERQHWVSRLQICTQHHTEAIGKNNPPLKSRSFSLASQGSINSPGLQRRPSQNAVSFFNVGHHRNDDQLVGTKDISVEPLQKWSSSEFPSRDKQASICQRGAVRCGALPANKGKEPEEINPDEELEDLCDDKEDDLGGVEEQRSVILHLLSQLKLGMDLTRVVLPTFILEKRSLLEMYADFMSHPDLFIAITNGPTPEERMIRFVEYYLTSFHEGRKGAIAKKPYNPIIGETFHCSWRMPKSEVTTDGGSNFSAHSPSEHVTMSKDLEGQAELDYYTVKFVAEQVSHHPPVSGFYAECVERKMCVNAHVWTKSKFLGMSIGVTMVGEGLLSLLEHEEEYTFSLPCAYARSILTVPWVELGGKVNINCAKTGYSASINFHTKPFYGGKLHRVTGEVKQNATNTVVCRVQGEWNSVLEFTYSNGETKYVDLTKLSVTRKRVRPIEKQGPFESRRLWQHVTESLRDGDIDKATEHKRALEERQRNEERLRAETETPWCTKYFIKEGSGGQEE
ncbi:hypothetical protein ASZ78_012413 [Callipepla squamata]|uniref:Oxysterol-binding protein n=1 Tax=Callipepla squamata TaxID=9009 RepID=A0A226MSU4_CALSU|nr:hypothetical protein ASZ78_012413 [Callipepla squamata]